MPSEFALFNWKTLKIEAQSFIDQNQTAKHIDIVCSVHFSRSKEIAKILFLLEHKSWEDPGLLLQILEYQIGLYKHSYTPVIPILIYHGRKKRWRGPLNFQDSLKSLPLAIRRKFGKNILN